MTMLDVTVSALQPQRNIREREKTGKIPDSQGVSQKVDVGAFGWILVEKAMLYKTYAPVFDGTWVLFWPDPFQTVFDDRAAILDDEAQVGIGLA